MLVNEPVCADMWQCPEAEGLATWPWEAMPTQEPGRKGQHRAPLSRMRHVESAIARRVALRTLLQLWSHLLLSVSQAFPAPARPLYPRLHGLYHRGWLAQCHQNGSVQGQLPHRRLHLPPAGHPDDIRVSDENHLCPSCGWGSRFLPCHCPWYQS